MTSGVTVRTLYLFSRGLITINTESKIFFWDTMYQMSFSLYHRDTVTLILIYTLNEIIIIYTADCTDSLSYFLSGGGSREIADNYVCFALLCEA